MFSIWTSFTEMKNPLFLLLVLDTNKIYGNYLTIRDFLVIGMNIMDHLMMGIILEMSLIMMLTKHWAKLSFM